MHNKNHYLTDSARDMHEIFLFPLVLYAGKTSLKKKKRRSVSSIRSVPTSVSSLPTLTPASSSALPFSSPFSASAPPICCSAFPSFCATSVPLTISTVTSVFTFVLPASLVASTSVQARLGAARSLPVPAVVPLSLLTSFQRDRVLGAAILTPAPSPLYPCLSIISRLLFSLLLSSARAR